MKTKKKTKKYNAISIEILNYVLDEIYKRFDRLEATVDSLKDKDAEVIDLDKEVEKSRHMKDIINDSQRLVAYKYTSGVDDSEEVEFTEEEKIATIELIEYAVHNKFIGWSSPKLWNSIIGKLNKMLKEKE